MQTRICTKCIQEKTFDNFNKCKKGKHGLRSQCRECDKSYNQQYNLTNAKYRANYTKEWHNKNPEYNKLYNSSDKGKAVLKAKAHNRRALKLNNGGKHTAQDILSLLELQSGKCVYCNNSLVVNKIKKFELDHIIPLTKNGGNGVENLQLLCIKCNRSKKDKFPEEFAAKFNKLF